MSLNYLEEYLVKLGFKGDAPGFAQFKQQLRDASSLVDSHSAEIVKSTLKWQGAIVSGFASVGAAALGLADKVAMADQEYRLFALRMYMTKDAARALKISMDALGQPMENLAWDSELRGRTHQLIEDQKIMAGGLGGDFESQMRRIRDIRFEFTRMNVESKYLAMSLVSNFMRALGVGPDGLLGMLQRINDWVIRDLPDISHKIVDDFMPIWQDVKSVIGDTADTLKLVGIEGIHALGALTGDKQLEESTGSWRDLATAIQDVSHEFADIALTVNLLIKSASHLADAYIGAFRLIGNHMHIGPFGVPYWGAASDQKEETAATNQMIQGVRGAVGNIAGVFDADTRKNNPDYSAILQHGRGWEFHGLLPSRSSVHDIIEHYASAYGVDPRFAHAIATTESGEHQYNAAGNLLTSRAGALGAMQLMPDTASRFGVNPNDPSQNVSGGLNYLKFLLARYGNLATAAGAYNWGEGHMDSFLAGKATMPAETRNYIASVMGQMGQSAPIQIGSITIPINHPNATPHEIQTAVTNGVAAARDKAVQRNLGEFGSLGWSY